MRKMSFRARFRLLIVLTLLLIALTTFAVGKYITTIEEESTVSFTARLAKDVILQEHKADRNADGSYTLTAEIATPDENGHYNSYKLIPGLDIPKDPHIVIQGKTPIPAYLYLEVEESISNTSIRWSLNKTDDNKDYWIESNKLAPKKTDNKIYVYSTDGANPHKIITDMTVHILEGDEITVNQALLSGDEENSLKFYAYLIEATD